VPSVDPSSTTTHSKLANVCARKLEYARDSVSTRLKVGVTMLKTGLRPACVTAVVLESGVLKPS
jgi:hypothetical protein